MHRVILNFILKPGIRGPFVEGFPELLVATRAHDGCKSVEILVDQNNADRVALYEKCSPRAHCEKYLAWRMETGVAQNLEPILAAPLEILHYDVE